MRSRIAHLLDILGLSEHADGSFQKYSTGMRQKLALARGLLVEPRILFLDEPTRSLDPISAHGIRQFIKERVVDKGGTVVWATHQLDEAGEMCHRVAIVDHGRILACGTSGDLQALLQDYERCELEVSHFQESLLPHLRAVEGVLSCSKIAQNNGTLTLGLEVKDRHAVLPSIIRQIVETGGGVSACRPMESSLEDVFLRIVEKMA